MDKLGPIEMDFILNSPEFKAASDQLKSEIEGIVSTAKTAATEAAAATAAVFSDSAKEIEEYKRKLESAGKMSGPLVESKGIEEANRQLELLLAEKARLQDFYNAGKLSAEAYQESVDRLAASERQLTAAVAGNAATQQGGETRILDEKQRALQAVSDEYRGVLESGMQAYSQLTPEAQRMIIQLNDMDDEMRMVSAAQANLSKRFEEGKIDANQYTQALAGLSVREAELRKGINETSRSLQGQGQAIAATKPQWNGLGNSINQITRELPAFTYSAQTGFMAISNNIPILVDEINRLKVANAAAAASGAATVPVWKAVRAAMFGWMTVISLAITALTVFGPKIFSYIKSLFDAKKALDQLKVSQDAINEAFKSGAAVKAIQEIQDLKTNLQLAKEGLIDKEGVVRQYNATVGEASKEVKTLNEVEEGLIRNADAYVKASLYKAAADASRKETAEQLSKLIQERLKGEKELQEAQEKFDKARSGQAVLSGTGATSNVSNAEQALKNAKNNLEEIDKLIEDTTKGALEIDTALKRLSLNTGLDVISEELPDEKKTKEKTDKSINQRQQLLDKIAAIDAEYARKSFTKDEEELQALKDKFAKVRELVERFNADPKNQAKRIDLTGLNSREAEAIGDLTFRQQTQVMEKEIARQKTLFEEYEAYKAKVGTEKAREAYADQLGEYDNYMDYLRSLIDGNQDTYTAITLGNATGVQQERYKMLEKFAQDENDLQRKKHQELESEYQSHAQRMKVRLENYLKIRAQLTASKSAEELAEMDKKFDEETKVLETAELKKEAAYRRVMNSVREMTLKQTKFLIGEAKKLLENEKLSAEERERIMKKLRELELQANRGSLENIYQISNALGALGQSLQNLGKSGSAISQIGGLMSGLASGVGDLLTVLDKESSDIDKIAAGINGLIKLVDMIGSAARQRREAEEAYYRSVISFQNEYNISLNEQLRLQSELGESVFLKDFEGRIKSGLTALADANKNYQEAMDKLAAGRAKSGQKNAVDWKNVGSGASSGASIGAAIGTFAIPIPVLGTAIGAAAGAIVGGLTGLFAGKKKKDTFMPLLEAYPALIQKSEDGVERINRELAETLIKNGMLDDQTKLLLENVLEWEDAIKEARDQIKGVISELAGSLSSDMRTALVDSFRAGEDAAIAMGKTVEKVLEDILSQLIFNKIFSEAFKDLEDQMAESMDTGGDGNWVDDFQRFFEASKGLSEQWDQAMKDAQAQAAAAGFNIFNPDSSATKKQGLTGGIERITESTGNELAGLFRGFYDLMKRSLTLDESRMAMEKEHYQAIIEGLNYWAAIEKNTGDTVAKLDSAIAELKEIKKNTKGGQSSWDLGLGNG